MQCYTSNIDITIRYPHQQRRSAYHFRLIFFRFHSTQAGGLAIPLCIPKTNPLPIVKVKLTTSVSVELPFDTAGI